MRLSSHELCSWHDAILVHILPTPCTFALVALLALPAASAERYSGVVTRVVDGHTLILRYLQQHISVQLDDIDAPEAGEPYARRSAQSLAQLCGRRRVTVTVNGSDDYGRVVGEVQCNGINANEEQLRRGMATVEPDAGRPAWLRLQHEAQVTHRGLWSGR